MFQFQSVVTVIHRQGKTQNCAFIKMRRYDHKVNQSQLANYQGFFPLG